MYTKIIEHTYRWTYIKWANCQKNANTSSQTFVRFARCVLQELGNENSPLGEKYIIFPRSHQTRTHRTIFVTQQLHEAAVATIMLLPVAVSSAEMLSVLCALTCVSETGWLFVRVPCVVLWFVVICLCICIACKPSAALPQIQWNVAKTITFHVVDGGDLKRLFVVFFLQAIYICADAADEITLRKSACALMSSGPIICVLPMQCNITS